MRLKNLWSQTNKWLRTEKLFKEPGCRPAIDDEGLISQSDEQPEAGDDVASGQNSQVIVKTVQTKSKPEPLEKLQEGFNKLIEQLQDINKHLNNQVAQQEDLMSRMDKLPKLLESFPGVVENQRQLTEQLFEQLRANVTKDQQFIDAVERIPTETGKQTDALVDINHQLGAAADIDVQMVEGFNKFNETLDNLNQSSIGQTDSIMQMSKTFAASDRYLKYIVTRQNKRLMWIFIAAISVCAAVILILTGLIIYIGR